MLVKSITTCFHYFCCVIDQTTEAFVALKESIAEKGGLELILVTQNGGEYRLVAGERRLLACRALNGETIPARILANVFEEYDVTALQLIENMLREDLNPLAQAKGILCYFQARHPHLFSTLRLPEEAQQALASASTLPEA
ncbi:MAG: ParB N-terminal domain-containing protein [Syntrophales bacterium]|jgi:hypothetical protein|nr:ParB N-terminal domain-containing protein [Syntrophales bacterium]